MDIDVSRLSPMMQQYMQLKEQYKGCLLFYRLGDFYEMFFDDAVLVSRELELTLTGRECGLPERAPMCGVPHHSVDNYIARLIKKGYKVAICEQLENPATAKGMVKRDVIRVVTPGTLMESNILEDGVSNYLCSICCTVEGYGLCFGDVSTGEMNVTQLATDDDQGVMNQLARFSPNEIIFNARFLDKKGIAAFIRERLCCTADLAEEESFAPDAARETVARQFAPRTLDDLGMADMPLAVCALGGLLRYLADTQMGGLNRIQQVRPYLEEQYMRLDITARRNLELTETLRAREKKGSLLWVLDKTKTSMGKRKIRGMLEQPLLSVAAIESRLNAVEELVRDSILVSSLGEALSGVYDMERLMTRIIYGNATPRDVAALGLTLKRLPRLRELLQDAACRELQEIHRGIDPLEDVCELIDSAIHPEPPITLKDGGVIRTGYSPDLDELRYLCDHTKEIIASIEQKERERTGIKSLKISYNKVFGYYIEISRANLAQAPEEYIRKQTLSNCERFITQELKELESKVLGAQQQIVELESGIFEAVRTTIGEQLDRIQRAAESIALLDVYQSFATVSAAYDYVRPVVDLGDGIIIESGRHPVVERLLDSALFVPNDVNLNNRDGQIAVITGPNMAGKSTYMRQVALITIMAQVGCFVPAKSAVIGVVDAVFTRVGASDDLASGQSTFMVEMNEVAQILRNATAKSLLILDEIGRGTSTFDGMSIARAVIEYIANKKKLGAKTLFATHYHELTVLESTMDCVKNYNIAVTKRGEDIIFLRRILPGGVDDSYGIEVSKLAGIPDWIIKRAFEVLEDLEAGRCVGPAPGAKAPKALKEEPQQMFFVDESVELLKRRIREADVDAMTPRDALNLVYELKKLV